ncbi:Monoterpene epsilon-lactone hydrolase [Sporomusa ovata DSM 2662]|uniref:Lipase/esterase n=1 Tax=Sporomusa ovata TaxID=2378 RepID=A0A0U1KTF9_9FIRM|nr:alpha/beta hydrolase [Sporomusa ovata]EQB26588.1 acetyl-hydrolase [Sporomusa ovata DSM 2662]CQR70677.1 Lipase/esterase [Sporomusa ovata]
MSKVREIMADFYKKMDPKNTLEQSRQVFAEIGRQEQLPEGTTVEKILVANLPAEWVKAANVAPENEQVILYFHGGAFTLGSCDTHRRLAALISEASGVQVLVIEYRLAPEHKYPAANDDCLAAYRWLIEKGISAGNIIIGGDSSGGTLTLMTLLSLRDAGDPLPKAAFFLSPLLDMIYFDGESYISRAGLDVSTLEAAKSVTGFYVDAALKPLPPILSPLNQDLRGLPNLFVQIGDHEVLLSDCTRLAERGKAAGVNVTLDIWDEMCHGFQFLSAFVPEVKPAIDNVGQFVKKQFNEVVSAKHI